MLKMRIQHLLEMKSNQEHRILTMDDLSNATGISRSALYKMNSDPNYNPSKEVMEKLVVYFQCTLDDLFDRTTKFAFDLSVFPKEKILSVTVLALLAASNDIIFLQRLWLRFENENNKGLNREIRNGEKTFVFLLSLGFLREGMVAFRRLFKDKTALQLFKKMDVESEKSFHVLKKESEGKDSLYNTILKNFRNDAAFHYNKKPFFQALQTLKQDKGHFIVGNTSAESRFLIADDIRSEIVRTSINFDDEHEQAKMGLLMTAMRHLVKFSRGFLIVYLDHQGAKFEPSMSLDN